jgi:hypothetical protein
MCKLFSLRTDGNGPDFSSETTHQRDRRSRIPGWVTFACSGLPADTGCSIGPAAINPSGTLAVSNLLSVNGRRLDG